MRVHTSAGMAVMSVSWWRVSGLVRAALLNRISSLPKRSTVVSMAALKAASSPMSRAMGRAFGPSLSATAWAWARSISATTTVAPSPMKRSAVTAPMPPAPPVMMATWPLSLCMVRSLLVYGYAGPSEPASNDIGMVGAHHGNQRTGVHELALLLQQLHHVGARHPLAHVGHGGLIETRLHHHVVRRLVHPAPLQVVGLVDVVGGVVQQGIAVHPLGPGADQGAVLVVVVPGRQPRLALGTEEDVDPCLAAVRDDDIDVAEQQIAVGVVAEALFVLDDGNTVGIVAAPVFKVVVKLLGVPLRDDEIPGHVRQHLAGNIGGQLGVVAHIAAQPQGAGNPLAEGRVVVDMVLLGLLAGHARALLA